MHKGKLNFVINPLMFLCVTAILPGWAF